MVVAAAMNAAYSNGADAACVDLGARTGTVCETWAFAVAKQGDRDRGRKELLTFGDRVAAHAVIFGLAYDDEAAIAHALAAYSAPYAEALGLVRAGAKVPARLVWTVATWLKLALQFREDKAATALTRSLPWPTAEREAFRARLAHEIGDPTALSRALEHATELASFEVIGLVAHAHGDFAAAATMLRMRANAGDAPVRVYLKGADALVCLGRKQDAQVLLAQGREARPHSKALLAA